MYRHAIALIATLAINSFAHAATNSESRNWECALDLNQGNTGAMSLSQSGDNVDGLIRITRNDSIFETDVIGRWTDDRIYLKRLLDTNSSEPMAGIVVTLGTKKVKIGGRFSTDYQGVWSADCDLASESIATQNEAATGEQASQLQPSTASRVSPNNPSDKDPLKFSAVASHPDGIQSITFYLGNNQIHSCDSSQCDITYGPIAKGNYNWRVEVMSQSGIKSSDVVNELVVRDTAITENCTISGSATGALAKQSPLYLVNLYGPNNESQFRAAAGFENGRYLFSSLPAGRYVLKVDTRADEGVFSIPSTVTLNCQSQSKLEQDFNFH